jgi:hypothetical protein
MITDTSKMARDEGEGLLEIFLWEIFSDRAVFDWFITLQEKSRYGEYQHSRSG